MVLGKSSGIEDEAVEGSTGLAGESTDYEETGSKLPLTYVSRYVFPLWYFRCQ